MANDIEGKLYRAVINKRAKEVIEICRELSDGPFHVITIHKDTVLHMALFSMQADLVMALLRLLDEQPDKNWGTKMLKKNNVGSTILHEAASDDMFLEVAREILSRAPQLLHEESRYRERAIFRAARFGQSQMFKFLDEEVTRYFSSHATSLPEFLKDYHIRWDEENKISSTVLHVAVAAEHFDLAYWIAEKYNYLINLKNEEVRTPLQQLARKPQEFRCGRSGGCVDRLIPSDSQWLQVPWLDELRSRRKKSELAMRLAKLLIEKDKSWQASEVIDEDQLSCKLAEDDQTSTSSTSKEEAKIWQETYTPLFLAAKTGCVDIVKEIFEQHPQAIEQVDSKGRTILHVVVKYRHMEILDEVEKMEIPMKRLSRKPDDDWNSILHMVGERETDHTGETAKRSPAFELQDDLLLFERVEKICSNYFIQHVNKFGKTAAEVFAENNEGLRDRAQDWLKRTAENCSIVAVLIATVAFAAAYTVPGGLNQITGAPLLVNEPFFVMFTVADVLSLTFTLTSVIVFLSILTSPFRLKDFKQSLPQQLMLGISFLIFSVSMMMLAFAATIILMIRNKQQWTKIALYTIAFLPVSVFAVSYLPLYVSLMKTFEYTVQRIVFLLPRFRLSSARTSKNISSSYNSDNKIKAPASGSAPSHPSETLSPV